MPPWLLAIIGVAVLAPMSCVEPPLGFLQEGQVARYESAGRIKTVYVWPRDASERIASADRELKEHGFRGTYCLEDGSWGATYTRRDGIHIRICEGRPILGSVKYFGITHDLSGFTTAVIDEPEHLSNAVRRTLHRILP